MKNHIIIFAVIMLAVWTVAIAVADNERKASGRNEVTQHCEQVDLGDGTFVCE